MGARAGSVATVAAVTSASVGMPRLILPPGWQLLPTAQDNSETARRVFASIRELGPRDSITPFARELERALQAQLDDAFRSDAFAVALPLGRPWEVPVSTSIAFSVVTPPIGTPALPAVGEEIDTDAGTARRRILDAPVPADAAAGELVLLRTLDYTWVREDAYVVAFASITGDVGPDYAPVTDALTLLITTMLDAVTFDPAPRQETQP